MLIPSVRWIYPTLAAPLHWIYPKVGIFLRILRLVEGCCWWRDCRGLSPSLPRAFSPCPRPFSLCPRPKDPVTPVQEIRHTRACHGYLAVIGTKSACGLQTPLPPHPRLLFRPTRAPLLVMPVPSPSRPTRAPSSSYPCLPRVSRCHHHRVSVRPLLSGNDGRGGDARGVGAAHGEIPVASTGMTDLLHGCDGKEGTGMTEVAGRGNDGGRGRGLGAALVVLTARYPWQARV